MLPRDGVETEPLGPSSAGRRSRKGSVQPRCDGRWILRRYDERPVETSQRLWQPTHARWRRPECHRRAPRAPPAQSPPAPRSGQPQRRPPGRRRPASSRRPGRGTGRGRRVAGDRRHRAALPPPVPPPRSAAACRSVGSRPSKRRAAPAPPCAARADGHRRQRTRPRSHRAAHATSLETPGRSAPDRLRGRSRALPTASRRIARSAGDEMLGTPSRAHRRAGRRTSQSLGARWVATGLSLPAAIASSAHGPWKCTTTREPAPLANIGRSP